MKSELKAKKLKKDGLNVQLSREMESLKHLLERLSQFSLRRASTKLLLHKVGKYFLTSSKESNWSKTGIPDS